MAPCRANSPSTSARWSATQSASSMSRATGVTSSGISRPGTIGSFETSSRSARLTATRCRAALILENPSMGSSFGLGRGDAAQRRGRVADDVLRHGAERPHHFLDGVAIEEVGPVGPPLGEAAASSRPARRAACSPPAVRSAPGGLRARTSTRSRPPRTRRARTGRAAPLRRPVGFGAQARCRLPTGPVGRVLHAKVDVSRPAHALSRFAVRRVKHGARIIVA